MTRRNTPRLRKPRQLGWVAEYKLAQAAKRQAAFRAFLLSGLGGVLVHGIAHFIVNLSPQQRAELEKRLAPYRTQPTAASMAMPVRVAKWPN